MTARELRRVGLGVVMAGLMAAPAVAQQPPEPTPVTPPTETTPETPSEPPAKGFIASGVTVDGVDISGLTREQARVKLITEIVQPKSHSLLVTFRGRRIPISPRSVGYTAAVSRAITGAYNVGRSQPAGPKDIALTERVDRRRLMRVLQAKTGRYRVAPRDVRVAYGGGKVRIIRSRPGIDVKLAVAMKRVESAVLSGRRDGALTLPQRRVRADVPTVPTQIFIDRGRFKLLLVRSRGIVTFPIAVGQTAYPTPSGRFSVVNMQRNPTWTPPDSRWAAGLGPVPPGVGNPLGTRWMGLSSPGIGIHGTPSPWSIGSRASHGCIRMYIRDAERLYSMISVGIPVTIV